MFVAALIAAVVGVINFVFWIFSFAIIAKAMSATLVVGCIVAVIMVILAVLIARRTQLMKRFAAMSGDPTPAS
jgi:hypothetical protein